MNINESGITASGMADLNESKVKEFLDLFHGSLEEATRALEKYDRDTTERRRVVTSTTPVLISIKDLQKQYKIGKQKIDALAGVTFDIHEGEFVALTGSSGSGKSTLLQLMGGLDKPTAGSVSVDNTDLTKMSDRKLSEFRGRTIGFVFQFFYLQPFLTLSQNLEVPGMFARTKRQPRRQKVSELAEAVKLADRLGHKPKELSGGQMQRAAIARALLNQPKLLLADEPTGNLDSANSHAIIELFDYIRKTFGTTIVIVTHDRDIARKADREISMKDGRIV